MRTHKIKQQKSKSKETTKQINAFSTLNNKAVQNQNINEATNRLCSLKKKQVLKHKKLENIQK